MIKSICFLFGSFPFILKHYDIHFLKTMKIQQFFISWRLWKCIPVKIQTIFKTLTNLLLCPFLKQKSYKLKNLNHFHSPLRLLWCWEHKTVCTVLCITNLVYIDTVLCLLSVAVWVAIIHIGTLGSILDFQLNWKSFKFQLERWNLREAVLCIMQKTSPPSHPTA